jgi:tryptophan synthase beta chain
MKTKNIPYKTYLAEDEMPKTWLNLRAFMPQKPDPMLHPGTGKPVTAEDLAPVFCDGCIAQELNTTDEFIDIPQEIVDFYKTYRPSPLVRAYNLEEHLGTPAEIYYKFEGTNTSGSHKLNSAVPQAYYAKQQGLTSAQQKPYRKTVMETFSANVIPSPSDTTQSGKKILQEHPDTGGSLGCAISEAVETAVTTDNTRYALGSVLDHVLLHQSIIGMECKIALDKYNIQPDIIIGCVGGGSNFGGLIAPYMAERLQGKNNIKFVAVEPASCPSLTRGKFAYDFGDTGKTTPLIKMYTLGSGFIPSPNHAGGLRYHGMNATISKLCHDGYIEAVSREQTNVFEAATEFARIEGYLPAPESSHAIRAAMDEAIRCRETGEKKIILFGLTGTGYFIPTDADLQIGFDSLPQQA